MVRKPTVPTSFIVLILRSGSENVAKRRPSQATGAGTRLEGRGRWQCRRVISDYLGPSPRPSRPSPQPSLRDTHGDLLRMREWFARWLKFGHALALLFILFAPFAAQAVEPSEILPDPALEARARAISAGLRCMVCQNQSIDDSEADLAKDLRILIREKLKQGNSDDQIRSYLVQRYGNFILLKPPFEWGTLLLWLGPALVLVLGAGASIVAARRKAAEATGESIELSETEKQKLAAILDRGGG
jgi:cytochrome c-type biogenesis protein CcmH